MQIPNVDHWQSGDRIWFTDWIVPFGHTKQIYEFCTHQVFANDVARSLYHKGTSKGIRIMPFHGIAVLSKEARHWFETHPVNGLNNSTN
jgi:cytolysin-activating lysine-acyltransferase